MAPEPGQITAHLADGPLRGETADVWPVEGRPPKTVDLGCPDGSTARYVLSEWTQVGHTADYSFLYVV